jgi:DNA-binding NarL/FixJ family response regulator
MLRALIVEDGALFRQLLWEVLNSRFPSIVIYEADARDEALEKVRAYHPDIVFIDIRLRDGNGLELTKKIKTEYPDTVAVILTNYDLPEYREAAFQYKADHFIPKDSFLGMINSVFSDFPVDVVSKISK